MHSFSLVCACACRMNLGLVEVSAFSPFAALLLPSASLLKATQAHDRSICDKIKTRTVQVQGFDRDGRLAATSSGFTVGPSAASAMPPRGLIVAAGHALTPPVQRFKVQYSDGHLEDVDIVAQPPAANVPDLMILGGSRHAELMQTSSCRATDTVYVLGCGTLNQLSFSRGTVSSAAAGAMTITAHAADIGFSGGPVVDVDGALVGVVKGPVGTTMLAVGITPVHDLHTYLLCAGLPGLQP